MILGDPALKADWMAELEAMRPGMLDAAPGLADALRRATNSDRFDFVAEHRGMFSCSAPAPSRWRRSARSTASTWSATAGSTLPACPAEGLDGLAGAIAAVGA